MLPLGKLPPDLLARLLALPPADPRVILGPGVGLDCAVIDFGDRYLVAKTDPITFASEEVGWYAVQINSNDIATTGALPRWFLATVLLPEGRTPPALAEQVLDQIRLACAGVGAELVGGHVEVTYGLDRVVVVGTMLGEVSREGLVTPRGARPGDELLLTRGVPLEGAALLAREKSAALAGRVPPQVLQRAANLLYDPGISVLPHARAALAGGRVHAMHDPTEGGLAGGLWELAEAAGLRIELQAAQIPLLPEGEMICRALGLDPLATLASGALLIVAPPQETPGITAALTGAGIPVSAIGRMVLGQGVAGLTRPSRDEIARVFETP